MCVVGNGDCPNGTPPEHANGRHGYHSTTSLTSAALSMLSLAVQCFAQSAPVQTVLRSQAESERSRPRGRAELLRVIELDPHEVGQDTANLTTERLAVYLCQQTGIQVSDETVRVYFHAHDYVCKRPTWTLRRKAEEKADYVGNACG